MKNKVLLFHCLMETALYLIIQITWKLKLILVKIQLRQWLSQKSYLFLVLSKHFRFKNYFSNGEIERIIICGC